MQVCQGISQTGIPQNRISPTQGEASSLPSGWNLASSTTALMLLTIQWYENFLKSASIK